MNNQTARRPDNKRPTRSAQQAKGYSKQTAHVQAVRDGQPLIFGGEAIYRGRRKHNFNA